MEVERDELGGVGKMREVAEGSETVVGHAPPIGDASCNASIRGADT